MHGDLYAHNTLIDEHANTIFGDFGAATIYDRSGKHAPLFERLDVRAFGCLVEDLLNQSSDTGKPELKRYLAKLKEDCMKEAITERPSFEEITGYLQKKDVLLSDTFCQTLKKENS